MGVEGGLVLPKEGDHTNANQHGVSSINSHATITNFPSSSSSPSPRREEEEEEEDNKKKEEQVVSVGFLKLFHFANRVDCLLLSIGTIGSVGHCASFPAFFYVIGALNDGFGNNQNNIDLMVSEVNKYVKAFVYVGIVVLFSSWIGNRLHLMGNFIHLMTTCVGGFVVGFIANWKLALVMIAVLPIIASAGILQVYTLTKLNTQGQKAYGEAGSIADQALTQIRTVYSFVGESKILRAYSERLKATLKLGYKAAMEKGVGIGSVFGTLFCSWAFFVWYAGVLVRNNEANGGKAISAIFAINICGIAIGQGLSNLTAFGRGKAALQAIMDVIEKKEKMDDKSTDGKSLSDVKGNIELCNVTFSYPSRPDVINFDNFSIHIASGQTVAIVGGSGSGKSTIISLVERFYDPTQGQVLLDGVDMREVQLKWLPDQIGLVNQEPALFSTSIKENILYGKPGASMHEIEQAAQAANAHRFISQFPQSYETQVGERGTQLSGGQKQRIAIARAVLKNPKILLLDEATSALDVLSEKVVQEALDSLMVGRTTVVVAHRLSTVRNVDTIAILEEGKVVEMGNHEELMEKGMVGKYAALVRTSGDVYV